MASATSTFASKEKENYYRLYRLLVVVGSAVLRETFEKVRPSGDLDKLLAAPRIRAKLRSLRQKKILSTSQWDKLYPSVRSTVSSKEFDTTLLGILLIRICNLQPPETGWNEFPPNTDTTIQANIIRLRFYDSMVHKLSKAAAIGDTTLNFLWKNIQDILVRLGGEIYRKPIDYFKRDRLDAVCEEHYKMLFEPKKMEDVSLMYIIITAAVATGLRVLIGDVLLGKSLSIQCIYFKFPFSLYLITFY